MQKSPELFDQRNEKKKILEFYPEKILLPKVGEFRRYREGVNIGHEISKDGKFQRVCFILSHHLGNGLLLIAPITTKYHSRMSSYSIKVKNLKKYNLKECWILLNQIKLIDKRRLVQLTSYQKPLFGLAKKVRYTYRKIIK